MFGDRASVLKLKGAVRERVAYSIASSELLFCTDDSSGTLSSIQSTFAADDGLTLRGTAARLASDLGDGIPIV